MWNAEFLLFIYLFWAASGLGCGTWTLPSSTQVSLIAAHRLSCPMACAILVPQPGIELTSPGLQGRLFATGPPGKSLPSVLMELLTLFLDGHPLAILLNFKRKQGMPKFSDRKSGVRYFSTIFLWWRLEVKSKGVCRMAEPPCRKEKVGP